MSERRTAIVGAGIAGLGAARTIAAAGGTPVLLESADRVGGRIQTLRRDGFTFDIGAFIYLGSYAACTEEMRTLGLEGQMLKADAVGAMPRDGTLHPLDLTKPWKVATTPYLSARGKVKLLRLLRLLRRHWRDLDYHDAAGAAAIDTETVDEYCARELDDELREYVAAVVVRGPWLSDPSYASVTQLLWTLKNFFKPYFYGLDDGMDALPRAMAQGLDVRLSTSVANVTDRGDGVEVTFTADGLERTERFDSAVITTTADQALALYPQMAGAARAHYEATEYIASVNTHLALGRRPENPATYIMCAPREQPDLCGVIVDHLKARNRVPEGKGMLTVFCRHEWCLEHLDAPDDVVLEQVLRFVEPYYGDLGATLEDHEIGRWRKVVPIMRKGRFRSVDAFLRETEPRARVQLAGDLGPIPGVNAALVSGRAAGERIVTGAGR